MADYLAIHWIAVPFLTALIAVVLIWGMRRDPKYRQRRMMDEILSDDPEQEQSTIFDADNPFPPDVLQKRAMLVGLWGQDTPDLIISMWSSPDEGEPRQVHHQQSVLPLSTNFGALFHELENRIFDGATDGSIKERSSFLGAYSFIRLPHRRQDLVVRTTTHEHLFHHELYLVEANTGKHALIEDHFEFTEDLFANTNWLEYRQAIRLFGEDCQPEVSRGHFLARIEINFCEGSSHAWLAHLGRTMDNDTKEVRRHLALASEFSPFSQIARIETAMLEGHDGLRHWIQGMHRYISARMDSVAICEYLLAQSCMTLNQPRLARMICEQLLIEHPRHSETARLLKAIDQFERGAQT